jgi:biotin carboxylase
MPTRIDKTSTAFNNIMTTAITRKRTLILVDPVTEWKEVVKASKHNTTVADDVCGDRFFDIVVAIQLIPLPPHIGSFVPSSHDLLSAGIDYVLTMNHRDIYACVHDIHLLLQQQQQQQQDSEFEICGVVPLSELAVDVSDLLAACFNVPHNQLHLLTSRRDKGMMKNVVSAAGLKVAKHCRISSVKELELILKEENNSFSSFPVVIKTPQGFSTTDVFICSSFSEAVQAFEHICCCEAAIHSDDTPSRLGPDGRKVQHALLEEYIDGVEFAVNIMVLDSQLVVTDVWRYHKTDKARYDLAEICNPYSPELEMVVNYAKQVAKAVGIRYGAAHVELKAKEKKAKNDTLIYDDPVMIEVGARLSGGRKATMTQAVIENWNPFANLISSHCGQEAIGTGINFEPKSYVRHLFLPIIKSGKITAIEIETSNLTTLHSVAILVKVGDVVKETTDITSCAGFAWFVGDDDTVKLDTQKLLSSYAIEVS